MCNNPENINNINFLRGQWMIIFDGLVLRKNITIKNRAETKTDCRNYFKTLEQEMLHRMSYSSITRSFPSNIGAWIEMTLRGINEVTFT